MLLLTAWDKVSIKTTERQRARDREDNMDLQEWFQEKSITEFKDANLNENVYMDNNLVIAESPSGEDIISSEKCRN